MAAIILGRPPAIACLCGAVRDYPIVNGLPPTGIESWCVDCGKTWRLVRYDFDDQGGTSWAWSDT